jgi:hypothetical protein
MTGEPSHEIVRAVISLHMPIGAHSILARLSLYSVKTATRRMRNACFDVPSRGDLAPCPHPPFGIEMIGVLAPETSVTVIWNRFDRTANASWFQLGTIPSLIGTFLMK